QRQFESIGLFNQRPPDKVGMYNRKTIFSMLGKEVACFLSEGLKYLLTIRCDVGPAAISRIQCGVILDNASQTFKVPWQNPIVRIQEKQPAKTSQPDSRISRPALAEILLLKEAEAIISLHECRDDAGGAIRGTIINNDSFPMRKRLSHERLKGV